MMRACGVFKGSIAIVMMLAFLTSCAAPAMLAGQGGLSLAGMHKDRPTGHVAGSETVTVYSGKAFTGKRVGVLNPGDTVAIEQDSDGWCQVSFDNGSGQTITGWVPTSYVDKGTAQNNQDLSGMKARTTVEGGLTGAAVGAAAGALVAAMVGFNPAKGAAIGAAIGAPLGVAAGVYVANQKAKYATEEQYLDACIAEARQYNEEARKDVEYMQGYIARERVRISKL